MRRPRSRRQSRAPRMYKPVRRLQAQGTSYPRCSSASARPRSRAHKCPQPSNPNWRSRPVGLRRCRRPSRRHLRPPAVANGSHVRQPQEGHRDEGKRTCGAARRPICVSAFNHRHFSSRTLALQNAPEFSAPTPCGGRYHRLEGLAMGRAVTGRAQSERLFRKRFESAIPIDDESPLAEHVLSGRTNNYRHLSNDVEKGPLGDPRRAPSPTA